MDIPFVFRCRHCRERAPRMVSLPVETTKGHHLTYGLHCNGCGKDSVWVGRLGEAVEQTKRYGYVKRGYR